VTFLTRDRAMFRAASIFAIAPTVLMAVGSAQAVALASDTAWFPMLMLYRPPPSSQSDRRWIAAEPVSGTAVYSTEADCRSYADGWVAAGKAAI
jgi:hypothetical protein